MKIQKANAGPLANFEVLDLLRSRGASKDPARVMASLASSEFKVYDYLVEGAACNQTRESINEFNEKCKEYHLTNAEIMSIINIRPSSEVEINPIIDQYDTRLGDKVDEFLEMVVQVLPPSQNQPNPDEAAAMDASTEAA